MRDREFVKPHGINQHKKARGQSYSRSMRRKALKERYGRDWKSHEFTLGKTDYAMF